MEVYIELAFLENFVLDGVLLYLALKLTKAEVSPWRLLLAAVLGGAEAVFFPLLELPVLAAYAVKGAGGVLLCLLAGKGKKIKPYLWTAGAFFALTFLLGGALTALYSFFGVRVLEGEGYLVEQAPIGLVLGGTAAFAIACTLLARQLYRFVRLKKNLVECVLTAGGKEVKWQGYADSGNRLEFRGKPVCVVSPLSVFALFGSSPKAEGRISVGTVHGRRDAPVFALEKLTVRAGQKTYETAGAYLTVGEVGKEFNILLSAALMED